MFLIDSNVLIDLVERDPAWVDWSAATLARVANEGRVCVNPIVFGEVSVAFSDADAVNSALEPYGLERLSLPYEAAFLAAKAHRDYRARGGVRQAILPDFLIGAHALYLGAMIVTRDPKPYRTYFPAVAVVAPALS